MAEPLGNGADLSTMDTLASIVVHELKQPLTAALAYITLLRRLTDDGTEVPSDQAAFDVALAGIEHAVVRCNQIILRTHAIAAGEEEAVRIAVNLRNIVGGAMRIVEHAPGFDTATVDMQVQEGAERAYCDPIQIEQVITNLVLNALEATHACASPLIRITCLPQGGRIEVLVEDNGPGITPGDEEHLFEPYYSSKPYGGGLGLPIARSIIEAHGGRIWCESAPAGGAIFHFTVPTAPRRWP